MQNCVAILNHRLSGITLIKNWYPQKKILIAKFLQLPLYKLSIHP